MSGSLTHPVATFHSDEVSRHLGVPASPVIHLAISIVADLLESEPVEAHIDVRGARIQRLRVASGAVLESLPLAYARRQLRIAVNAPLTEHERLIDEPTSRVDWLTIARAALIALGLDPGPDTRGMATLYGWRAKP